ncbi:hypothetical protein Hanom_Chr16g01510881 [Helianthus anomalus]
MNIETINKPSSLCTVLHGLSDGQKSDITDMGFESIKSFSINKIPSRLGSWLLANYDHKSNVLKVGDGIINIRAFTSNPSNYTYIPLKNNSYINTFPLKQIFFLCFSIK